MFNNDTTDTSRIGGASRRFAGTPLKLMVALGAAMLMLFLVAGTGDTKSAFASNSAPITQQLHVLQDGCGTGPWWGGWGGYMPWVSPFDYCNPYVNNAYINNGYVNPGVYGYAGAYGYAGIYGNSGVYNNCAPVPGAYTCNGYCGTYSAYFTCAPACAQYSCAPGCVQAYAYYYGNTVPCSLPVDRVSFIDPPLSISCGASVDLTVNVWDSSGNLVPDGTSVKFQSSLGGASATATISNGRATVHMTASSSAGLAQITAASGNVEGSTIIMVQC